MKIICLANSYKHHGRCIAGINPENGEWIRPISYLDDGRIPLDNPTIPAAHIRILDRVEIPLQSHLHSGHEQENRHYGAAPWLITGQAEVAKLLRYRETRLLYGEFGKSIPFSYLQARQPVRSLQLIETKSLLCQQDRQGKWRAIIQDPDYGLSDFELSITDPVTLDKLQQGHRISQHCLLCLSLSQPWQPNGSVELACYRLVAGVIELPPVLEGILEAMDRLGWTTQQGRDYLRVTYGKTSRYQLSSREAETFLADLQGRLTGAMGNDQPKHGLH